MNPGSAPYHERGTGKPTFQRRFRRPAPEHNRGIGDLVLKRDAITQPAEAADIAISQALGLASKTNLAILATNAITRSHIKQNLPGNCRTKRGGLTLLEIENSRVRYRFDRAQVAKALAVEKHKPDFAAINGRVDRSVINIVAILRPRLGGRRR